MHCRRDNERSGWSYLSHTLLLFVFLGGLLGYSPKQVINGLGGYIRTNAHYWAAGPRGYSQWAMNVFAGPGFDLNPRYTPPRLQDTQLYPVLVGTPAPQVTPTSSLVIYERQF